MKGLRLKSAHAWAYNYIYILDFNACHDVHLSFCSVQCSEAIIFINL